ncbi:hypothetical protein Taro_051284 [Colocasia esculenta]|uniref:Uncharacterized protein n=1 Tax=Colocasia esculenta TaxID=4460 RepID=A0A843XG52_COLES|nr:hypothetical protein [Colocasia esculenta]
MIKSVAVNLERDKKFDEVKELDDAVLEIIKASDECSYFSSAIQLVAGGYQLGEQSGASRSHRDTRGCRILDAVVLARRLHGLRVSHTGQAC